MGPAAIPIAEAAVSVFSVISGVSNQKKEAAAQDAAATNQANALAQAQNLAEQQATGPSFQSLLDAQQGGVATLKSTLGGVANPGALIKTLFGGDISNAISASLANRNANLSGASSTLLNAGQQYGAGATPSSTSTNPYTNAATGLFGALNQLGTKPNQSSGDIIPSTPSGGSGIPNPDILSGIPNTTG